MAKDDTVLNTVEEIYNAARENKNYDKYITDCTVIELVSKGIVREGKNSVPLKFIAMLEADGSLIEVTSWSLLSKVEIIKEAVNSKNVYKMHFTTKMSTLDDVQTETVVANGLFKTEGVSERKKFRELPEVETVISEVNSLIDTYIKNESLKKLVTTVTFTDAYRKWAAATSHHHEYKHGLIIHSLEVAKLCISIVKDLDFQFVNMEVLVAGALIHDIGKINEYYEDGTRSTSGLLTTHVSYGIMFLTSIAERLNISTSSLIFEQLIGIIATHHGKLEYGATNLPSTPEMMIIHLADRTSSVLDNVSRDFNDLKYGANKRVKSAENNNFLKINNDELLKSF